MTVIDLFEHNKTAYGSSVSLLSETGKAAVIHPTDTGKSLIVSCERGSWCSQALLDSGWIHLDVWINSQCSYPHRYEKMEIFGALPTTTIITG